MESKINNQEQLAEDKEKTTNSLKKYNDVLKNYIKHAESNNVIGINPVSEFNTTKCRFQS